MHARRRTSRRGSMTFPLVVLALLVDRRRPHQPAVRRPASSTSSTIWLEPVVRRRRARCTSSSFALGFVLSTVALVIAVVGIVLGRAMYRNGLPASGDDPGRSSGSGRSPRCSPTRTTSTSGSPASSAARSPRPRASSAAMSTTRASTARSTASAAGSGGAAADCASCRPAWCATTRSAIVFGAVLLVGYMFDRGRCA